jgi:hypothetical protein
MKKLMLTTICVLAPLLNACDLIEQCGSGPDPEEQAARRAAVKADRAKSKTTAPTMSAAPTSSAPSAVKSDPGCPIAAERFIKKMWKCGLNAQGITAEDLCRTVDTSTIRYASNIETCNEFLTKMNLQ